MASVALTLPLLLLIIIFSLHPAVATKGMTLEIVHRDSPKSPLYDSSATPVERQAAAVQRSNARAHHISAFRTHVNPASTITSWLSFTSGEYSMEFQLGTPSTKVVAFVDTGSDLTWTNCQPCRSCYSQIPPMFNPYGSSSFRLVKCYTLLCSWFPNNTDCTDTCKYKIQYSDGSIVDGSVARDVATFNLLSGTNYSKFLTFGCNSQTSGRFPKEASGIVGLGTGVVSLISQLASGADPFERKFSYCFVDRKSILSSRIYFGNKAILSGDNVVSTPFTIAWGSSYALTLHQISIPPDTFINVSVEAAPLDGSTGNIIIDSGAELIHLVRPVLQRVVGALKSMPSYPIVDPPPGFDSLQVCFNVSGARPGLPELPNITFSFQGLANVVLRPLNWLWRVDDEIMCLAMEASSIQIFGNIAQQKFRVGYDLVSNQISFQPAPLNCQDF